MTVTPHDPSHLDLREKAATKSDIRLLDTKIAAIEGKLTLLVWAVGINVAATLTMLVHHW